MAQRVPSFAGHSHRQSAEYDSPYKRARHDKLRGFFNPRNAPRGGVVVERPVTPEIPATQVEIGPMHDESTGEHRSSEYNLRMARYFKKLGAR